MPDWTKSMSRMYEYYKVNPVTWKDTVKLENIKTCTIERDLNSDTLGSATFEIDGDLEECYIRVYLITIQNGIAERFALGTFLAQAPSVSYDGYVRSISVDAYTPLLELKEKPVPLGYSLLKNQNSIEYACKLTAENCRAPVIKITDKGDMAALYQNFVANTDDVWLTYIRDLLNYSGYSFVLNELGVITFAKRTPVASMQPVWTYDDGNSSILYPDLNIEHDIYGIPNAVEVIYSVGGICVYAKAVNDNPNSLISTVTRGREILYRETDVSLIGYPTEARVKQFAEQRLSDLSTLEYTIQYSHAYHPTNIGDCVRINYERSGFTGIKARVISQSIECTPECKVSETAVYTENLWR